MDGTAERVSFFFASGECFLSSLSLRSLLEGEEGFGDFPYVKGLSKILGPGDMASSVRPGERGVRGIGDSAESGGWILGDSRAAFGNLGEAIGLEGRKLCWRIETRVF